MQRRETTLDAVADAVAVSLLLLTLTLAVLSARGFVRFFRGHLRVQLWWGLGLALGTAATAVELVIYLGFVDGPLLQAYVFLSAAIVGILSLGSTRVLHRARFENGYAAYTLAMCSLVGALSFMTPMPSSMVSGGVVAGNPPLLLLVLSSFVTVPATFVLLGAVVVSLRKSWRWQTLMMGFGASVLAAGGALYIASFPVALYYAEFIGIVLIFVGLVSLPQISASPVATALPLRKDA
jgi:hypothetical protein